MVFSKNLGWIGVDVGTHTVKLAQAVRTPAGMRLRSAAVIQRPVSWSGDDTTGAAKPAPSRDEIHAALDCGGFVGRNAACTLPMNVCQLRGLHLPQGTDRERKEMIASEMSEDWGIQASQMVFDYWELDTPGSADNTDQFNVDVLAICRPWVGQLARDCRQSRLDCWVIDGAPLAMARAVGMAGRLAVGEKALAIDWGYSNTTICVVGDERPLYARRLQGCGLRFVLEQLSASLAVTLDEAQHLLQTQGISATNTDLEGDEQVQRAISKAVAEVFDELICQTNRTLQFIESQRRRINPKEIWLLGGGASIRNIGPHLTDAFDSEVRVWDLPKVENESGSMFGGGTAIFGPAAALSALAWRAA